jgi:hypothetical protein
MDGGNQCDDRLPSTDISLEESSHSMGLFHIFEDLKENNFLFIREREGDICYDLLDELCIEWCPDCMAFTCCECAIFFFETTSLECEKLPISELTFCSFKCSYRCREVYIANICTFDPESFFLTNLIRNIISYLINIPFHETHLLADPCTRDVVHITVYWHDLTSCLSIVFDICTIP